MHIEPGEEVIPNAFVMTLPTHMSKRDSVGVLSEIGVTEPLFSSEFQDGAVSAEALESDRTIVFEELGLVLADLTDEKLEQALENSAIEEISPDWVYREVHEEVSEEENNSRALLEYLRGCQDSIGLLLGRVAHPDEFGRASGVERFFDAPRFTWGVMATRADTTRYTGAGIRVAVLDTGIDTGHPDFRSRVRGLRSFINGESPLDRRGHGTHVAGTVCGPSAPQGGTRYGVAPEAELWVGKVLDNTGRSRRGSVLAGFNWAVANKCVSANMSLGSGASGGGYDRAFERAAANALASGTVPIASAGNSSERPGRIAAVGHPANCPSVLGVGAVDRNMKVAEFSSGGLHLPHGAVDLAGPGVSVWSSRPRRTLYGFASGTSMAAPHVSGISALYAESDPELRGRQLWAALERTARSLPLPQRDVGKGLVQAPR